MGGGWTRWWTGLLLLAAAAAVGCGAAQYTVGESNGWGLGQDLGAWVSQRTFHVGDDLYFPYPPGQHSVMLVGEDDYNKCNTENPIASDSGEGNMVITIISVETYYFICGVPGHCAQGLRLAVPVEPTPPTDESPPSEPETPPHDVASPPPTHDDAPPQPPHDDASPPPPSHSEAPPHEDASPTTQHSPPDYKEYNSFHPIANSASTCYHVIITFSTFTGPFLAPFFLMVFM